MDKYLDRSLFGQFSLSEVSYSGLLTISRATISLAIYSDNVHIPLSNFQYPSIISGTLFDLTKITLLDVVFLGRTSYRSSGPGGELVISQQLNFQSRYVLFSDISLNVEQSIFNSFSFCLPNGNELFCFKSFSQVIHATESLAKGLLGADFEEGFERYGFISDMDTYKFGSSPQVYIYTGARDLIDFQFPFGNLIVRNNLIMKPPHNSGFSIENNISCDFKLSRAENFWAIVEKIRTLQNLLALILGCKQVLTSFNLMVDAEDTDIIPHIFRVYHAVGEQKIIKRFVHPMNRLVHVETEIEEFNTIINNWFLRQNEWKFARSEFFTVFNDFKYNSDVLLKLSNLFDILPSNNKNEAPSLSNELIHVIHQAKQAFSDLPDFLGKDKILGALNGLRRAQRKTLKDRILDRYSILNDKGFVQLDEIDTVITQIVKCRNFFVHGRAGAFDHLENTDLICFFIDTLAFIYAASEMIECGWSFSKWTHYELNEHPFSIYILSYDEYVSLLKKSIANN